MVARLKLRRLALLAANPGFTLTVVAVLALGIGANTTMFSVVNTVLLRPIPWENPDRLVLLREVNRKQEGDFINPSTANYFDWRYQNHDLQRVGFFALVQYNVSGKRNQPRTRIGLCLPTA